MHKSIVYVQIHFGKTYVYTPSKILFLRKDSNFNFHWAFKTWQTSDPPKVVAATFEIFNGLNIHSYVSQPFRLHYYNAHLRNLHWNAHFLYFSASPFFLPCIEKSSTDSVTHWFMNWLLHFTFLWFVYWWSVRKDKKSKYYSVWTILIS